MLIGRFELEEHDMLLDALLVGSPFVFFGVHSVATLLLLLCEAQSGILRNDAPTSAVSASVQAGYLECFQQHSQPAGLVDVVVVPLVDVIESRAHNDRADQGGTCRLENKHDHKQATDDGERSSSAGFFYFHNARASGEHTWSKG